MRVAYPLRPYLEAAGISALMWDHTFRGDTSYRRHGLSIRTILSLGL